MGLKGDGKLLGDLLPSGAVIVLPKPLPAFMTDVDGAHPAIVFPLVDGTFVTASSLRHPHPPASLLALLRRRSRWMLLLGVHGSREL